MHLYTFCKILLYIVDMLPEQQELALEATAMFDAKDLECKVAETGAEIHQTIHAHITEHSGKQLVCLRTRLRK